VSSCNPSVGSNSCLLTAALCCRIRDWNNYRAARNGVPRQDSVPQHVLWPGVAPHSSISCDCAQKPFVMTPACVWHCQNYPREPPLLRFVTKASNTKFHRLNDYRDTELSDSSSILQVNIAGVDQSNGEIQRKKVEAWWNPTSSIFELLTKAPTPRPHCCECAFTFSPLVLGE